jgi:hypothetical protein
VRCAAERDPWLLGLPEGEGSRLGRGALGAVHRWLTVWNGGDPDGAEEGGSAVRHRLDG